MTYWDVASDEDSEIGYLRDVDELPKDPDAILGIFIVAARREWGIIYDSAKLQVSRKPKGYRASADGERMIPARKTADSHWWVIEGLRDAEANSAW